MLVCMTLFFCFIITYSNRTLDSIGLNEIDGGAQDRQTCACDNGNAIDNNVINDNDIHHDCKPVGGPLTSTPSVWHIHGGEDDLIRRTVSGVRVT